MIHQGPLKKLKIEGDLLTIKTGIYKNISFFILFIILLIAVITNISFPDDFRGQRLTGTLVIIILLVSSALMSLHRWELKAKGGRITIQHNFMLFSLLGRSYSYDELKSIEVEDIQPGGIARYKFYQLFLFFQRSDSEKREVIYSTSDQATVKEMAESLKSFFRL